MNNKFVINSQSFKDQGTIPDKYSAYDKNISPELSWSGEPTGTTNFLLIMDDPDAPNGTYVHWVLSLPNTITNLAENAGMQTGYFGPRPPSGKHRYYFTLFALSAPYNGGKITAEEFRKKYKNLILSEATMMGLYSK